MRTLLLFASLLITPSTSAPPSATDNATQADALVAKAITAMGGTKRIEAIHSLIFRGFHYEGAYKQEYATSRRSSGIMVRMRPGLRLVGCRPEVPGCDNQWGRIVEGFDGARGWELNWPKQRLVRTVNKAEQALRCGAAFDYLFINYRQRGFHATYLGRKTILSQNVEALEIQRDNCGLPTTYYFDPGSYELRMSEIRVPVHARGDVVDRISVNQEFTTVNGVRLPSRQEEINLATGDVLEGGQWTIEANTLQDRAIFDPPQVHPQGITAVVLNMLAASDQSTPQQMMQLYSRFRSSKAGESADVVYDMNWLGFELLKVDRYNHALAVFDQIIAENPGSASAYASLGEAYLQMKQDGKAKAAFQRAIDLGLNDDDVQKKLARLQK